MFTGLIEAVGVVAASRRGPGGVRVRVDTSLGAELRPGDSLAVNGVCLTVVDAREGSLEADIGPETLRVTTLGRLEAGWLVNLERPLKSDGRLGGHFVLGHVDGVGTIENLRQEDGAWWLTARFPAALAAYLIPKGSIAVDGISLTVARLRDERFDVQIVPFTLAHTNLQRARAGDGVNLECDVVGKYVVRAAELAGLLPEARRAEVSS